MQQTKAVKIRKCRDVEIVAEFGSFDAIVRHNDGSVMLRKAAITSGSDGLA